MGLRSRISKLFQRTAASPEVVVLSDDFTLDDTNVLSVDPPTPQPRIHRPGRVIKRTKHAEYSPIHKGKAGVIRVMPRQLKDIKEAQERPIED